MYFFQKIQNFGPEIFRSEPCQISLRQKWNFRHL